MNNSEFPVPRIFLRVSFSLLATSLLRHRVPETRIHESRAPLSTGGGPRETSLSVRVNYRTRFSLDVNVLKGAGKGEGTLRGDRTSWSFLRDERAPHRAPSRRCVSKGEGERARSPTCRTHRRPSIITYAARGVSGGSFFRSLRPFRTLAPTCRDPAEIARTRERDRG